MPFAAFELEFAADASGTAANDSGRLFTLPSFRAAAATRSSAAAAMLDVFLGLPVGATSLLGFCMNICGTAADPLFLPLKNCKRQ
jgi:hypothetical protein